MVLPISIADLRAALGIPNIRLMGLGNLNQDPPHDIDDNENIDDTDHADQQDTV